MFQFKDLIQTGMESAKRVEENRRMVDEVFTSLNIELEKETNGLITIQRYRNIPGALKNLVDTYNAANKNGLELSLDKKPNKGTLNVVLNNDANASIARWEQDPEGYPFTIEFMGERTDCWDQEAVANALGQIIVSGQLWLKVKELQSKTQKEEGE
jgi:hypothetical protein